MYALVWPVIRGVTLSDYGMATGFGFGLISRPVGRGPLPKGRDHSHVESGKHIYNYVSIVYCCCLLSFLCISLL